MLPPYNEDGYLPPGIHQCTLDEIEEKFGHGSPEREIEIRELRELVGWARQAGIRRIVVNGSFVTDKQTPNDVDVIVLPGVDYPRDQQPASDEAVLWPFSRLSLLWMMQIRRHGL